MSYVSFMKGYILLAQQFVGSSNYQLHVVDSFGGCSAVRGRLKSWALWKGLKQVLGFVR